MRIPEVKVTIKVDDGLQHAKDSKILIDYLLLCVRRGDWHGVGDAANDLRVLEAEAKGTPPSRMPKEITVRPIRRRK